MSNIHPQAVPFSLKGNSSTAILFIHGFTASPSEVYPAARLLHEISQHTVNGLLLPGHGTSPAEMNQTVWLDWFKAVEAELNELKQNYEEVFVAGLSMGGLLALHAGIIMPEIRGAVVINPPVFNRFPLRTILLPLIQLYRPYVPKKNSSQLQKLAHEGRYAYDCTPLKAFKSMMRLRNQVLNEIRDLRIPLLLMQSGLDESVKVKSGYYLKSRAINAPVRLLELKYSEHVATMGPEKEKIAADIFSFIKENSLV